MYGVPYKMYGVPYKMYGASYILYVAANTCMVRAVLYCTVLRSFSHFHAIYRCFPYKIRVCSGIVAFGRRRGGAAVGRRNVIFDASLQPGTGSGVGGKGRWTAIAVPP